MLKRSKLPQQKSMTWRAQRANAPVAQAIRSKRVRDSQIKTIQGTDMLYINNDITTAGVIPVNVRIQPSITERLENIATQFQRIRYKNLRITVETGCASTALGTYVAAIIKDPADNIDQMTSLELYTYLVTNAGAKTSKSWQSTTVAQNFGQWMYTDLSVEPRTYSPGRIVVVFDKIPEAGTITVRMDWIVDLKDATTRQSSSHDHPVDPTKSLKPFRGASMRLSAVADKEPGWMRVYYEANSSTWTADLQQYFDLPQLDRSQEYQLQQTHNKTFALRPATDPPTTATLILPKYKLSWEPLNTMDDAGQQTEDDSESCWTWFIELNQSDKDESQYWEAETDMSVNDEYKWISTPSLMTHELKVELAPRTAQLIHAMRGGR